MSAFFSVCYPDRIELLTDGAIYADDGMLLKTARKVFPSAVHPLAVTGRGGSDAVRTFAHLILAIMSASPTVDEGLLELDRYLLRLQEKFGERAPPTFVEMLIPCISESKGPINIYCASSDVHGLAVPWRLHAMPFVALGGPKPADDEIEAMGGEDAIRDGLQAKGEMLFGFMRRQKFTNPAKPENPPLFGIGGFVDHTIITAGGVTVNRLHTWEDEIGKPIDPFKHERAPQVAAA